MTYPTTKKMYILLVLVTYKIRKERSACIFNGINLSAADHDN
jgi:hypothetical protein